MVSLSLVSMLNYATLKVRTLSFKQAARVVVDTCVKFTEKYGPFEGLVYQEPVQKISRSVSIDDIESQRSSVTSLVKKKETK